MILIAISYHARERKQGNGDDAPGKCLEPHLFHARESPLLSRESTKKIQKALSFLC